MDRFATIKPATNKGRLFVPLDSFIWPVQTGYFCIASAIFCNIRRAHFGCEFRGLLKLGLEPFYSVT
jgi:hypothetical protein